jgi:hypothetical protein
MKRLARIRIITWVILAWSLGCLVLLTQLTERPECDPALAAEELEACEADANALVGSLGILGVAFWGVGFAVLMVIRSKTGRRTAPPPPPPLPPE